MNQVIALETNHRIQRLGRLFSDASGGVVGLVDELLELCREQELQLEWRAGQCRVTPVSPAAETIEFSLPKSVFRAILARVATLCNERLPNSVWPYGGQGELVVDAIPPMAIRVVLVNSPDVQSLELAPLSPLHC